MEQTEQQYLRRREAQHRARAEFSEDPAAKGLHGRFADAYAERARILDAEQALIVG